MNTQKIENEIYDIFHKLKDKSFNYNYISKNTDETKELAYIFAKNLNIGDVIVLNGELGTGKTVFMSGIAKYFEIENLVSSPTFTIVNRYLTNKNINISHFDVYRINNIDEFLEDIGTDSFTNDISIIEWGNIIKEILPKNTIYIDITKDNIDYDIRYFHIWRN